MTKSPKRNQAIDLNIDKMILNTSILRLFVENWRNIHHIQGSVFKKWF